MKYTDGKNIMVYAQSADGAPVGAALETVSKAAELAKANGEEVIAVVFGKDTDTKTVITSGASKVLVAGEEALQAEEKAQILAKLAEKYQPKAVYMAGTPEGKMIAPAVSAVFESGCVTDVTGITADGVYTSLSYNGNVLNDMKMGENLPHVATVRSGSFAKNLDEGRTGEVIAEDASADTVRTKVVETVKEIAETVNLEEAQIIVSGGRNGQQGEFCPCGRARRGYGRRCGSHQTCNRGRLGIQSPPGRAVRQDRRSEALHRMWNLRRHPACIRHDRFRLYRSHQ